MPPTPTTNGALCTKLFKACTCGWARSIIGPEVVECLAVSLRYQFSVDGLSADIRRVVLQVGDTVEQLGEVGDDRGDAIGAAALLQVGDTGVEVVGAPLQAIDAGGGLGRLGLELVDEGAEGLVGFGHLPAELAEAVLQILDVVGEVLDVALERFHLAVRDRLGPPVDIFGVGFRAELAPYFLIPSIHRQNNRRNPHTRGG
jgi:hypothetical protein